jgi:hypothetical protein
MRIGEHLGRWTLLALVAIVAIAGSVTGYALLHHTTSPGELARQVGAAYGDPAAQIVSVHKDVTDDPSHQKTYIIRIRGNFHKGDLQAPVVIFSALANGQQIWAILGEVDPRNVIWHDDRLPSFSS